MIILVQIVKGNAYELEVTQHTSIEEACDLLIKNYGDEKVFKDNPLSNSNNQLIIEYRFVFNGKYLFDPDPFSILKENQRVILYIQKREPRGNFALEIGEESENENENENEIENNNVNDAEEEDLNQDIDWNSVVGRHPDLAGVLQRLRPIVIQAAETALVDQAYNPQNNFWIHAPELAQIENIFQNESSQAAHFISSSFLRSHFHQLLRYNNINIGTILNMMGGGPLFTFGDEQNLDQRYREKNDNNNYTDNSSNNDNNNNNNSNDNNNNNNNDNNNNDNNNNSGNEDSETRVLSLFNNNIYTDYNNTNYVDEIDILIMEMSTNQRNAYNEMLDQVRKSSQLSSVIDAVGILRITQIFKECNYDISKTIESIKQLSGSATE